ncbi:MAG TPA: hypothetical protein DCM05_07935 [Elusimicrobia bacterium]|nr:hypothetical protein [Elusimicrobiota bacterium]
MSAEDKSKKGEDVLSRQVVYDGEGYTREGIEKMLTDYQSKNSVDLQKFDELSGSYQRLSKDMTQDIGEQKSVMDYLGNIFSLNQVGTNLKGLLQRIPGLGALIPARGLKELLNEKIEIAQRRVQEVGNYLDTLQADIKNLQDDITRLNKKMVSAAQNKEKAALYVLDLEEARKRLETQLAGIADPKSLEAREMQAKIDEVRKLIYEHGARLRLYANAAERISAIVKMSNNFLEIMTNLNSNMTQLYESGTEVLNELHGNLAGLASMSKAGELSVEMHKSMESLKKSVNRLATLASETSLFLTKNVDRLTSEMKMYDKETEKLVESNLAAEKEIREKRIDDTIALAKKEYGQPG